MPEFQKRQFTFLLQNRPSFILDIAKLLAKSDLIPETGHKVKESLI